jgi:hypothetical protein
MTAKSVTADPAATQVLTQPIVGSRRLSNYFWAVVVSMGGVGFLLAGISSYLKVNLLPFSDPTQLVFLPQGIAMSFYGLLGSLFAAYLWGSIALDIGGGYNRFDKTNEQVTIFRWGFPGKNRKIEVNYKTSEIQSIKVDINDGFSPRRNLYLRVKGKRDLPLTRVGQPMSLAEIENQGAELARFLGVPLEGL